MPGTCIRCSAPLKKDRQICPECGAHVMLAVWMPEDGVQLEDRIWEGLKLAAKKSGRCPHLCARHFVTAIVPPTNSYRVVLRQCALEWFQEEYPEDTWWSLDIHNAPPDGWTP